MGAVRFALFLGVPSGRGGSSTGRSNSLIRDARRCSARWTCSMWCVATVSTMACAVSLCSRCGSAYSARGRFLMAVTMLATVILRLVIKLSSIPTITTITAPIRLMSAASRLASPPDSTPPAVPLMPPSQSAVTTSQPSGASKLPPTSCTRLPTSAAVRNVHVTRSATGRPSCRMRMRKLITNENGRI